MKTHPVAVFLRLAIGIGLVFGPTQFCEAAGKVAAWGDNAYSQRVLPNGLNDAKAFAVGGGHCLALKASGEVVAWGYSGYGQTNVPAALANVRAIAAGAGHSLALKTDGTVVGWGLNNYGQATAPSGLAGVIAISAGAYHNLALKVDGTVVGWGYDAYGQTNVPADLTNVVAIAAGGYHNVALKGDGTVFAWGRGTSGETNVPLGLSNVVAIAAGGSHSLALKSDGQVIGWGSNLYGQSQSPANESNFVALAAGYFHSTGLRADGTVTVWGSNNYGQTNVPAGLSNATAIAAGGDLSVALVADGPVYIVESPPDLSLPYTSNGTFSVVASGHAPLGYRWFFNGFEIGSSARFSSVTNDTLSISNAQFADIGNYSVLVSNAFGLVRSSSAMLTVVSPPIITFQPVGRTVVAGTNITLNAAATGTPPLSCRWLFNGTPIPGAVGTSLSLSNVQPSQSGNYSLLVSNVYGVTESSNALVTVLESSPYILKQPTNTTATLGGLVTFTVEARGSTPMTYQWRFNGADILNATNSVLTLSSLGYDDAGFYTVVISNHVGTTVSAKVELSIRQVAVWGSSSFSPTNVPASVTNLVAISAGNDYLAGLTADGTVAVFPGRLPRSFVPTNIPPGLSSVSGIAAGEAHCLAVRSNGTVVAWGGDSGIRMPAPSYGTTNLATNVPAGLSNVISVAAGDYLSLALKSDGKVVSWGGYSGGLWGSSGYVFFTNVPANLSNVVAVAAGGDQSLALKSDGRVVAWSNGTNVPSSLSNVIAIACSGDLGLALQTNGKVVAWSTVPQAAFPYPSPIPRRGFPATNVPTTLSNVVAVAAGSDGSIAMALKADGTVTTWGSTLLTPFTNSVPPGLFNVFAITAGGGFFAALAGDGAPHMTIQPASQTTVKGTNLRLSGRAVGVQPMTYQWQLDGANLAGATNADLLITNIAGSQTGNYRVIASNPVGSVTSAIATVTIPFSTNLAIALNATNLTWTTSPTNVPWFAQNRETHDGDAAAQSGPIGNNQQSLLQAAVVGPGTLTFWWKVSSEQAYDRLWFNMDYQNWATWISGETDWQQVMFAVPAGTHTLNWAYIKDGTVTSGKDAGWLDEVTFTPAAPFALSAPQHLADGSFAFWSIDSGGRQIQPVNLSHIEIQASTNLQDWVVLPGAGTLTNGSLWIRDPSCTNFPQRFYRVIEW
ncbi:MAG TPA: immunoglobulin domain-containing protein [Verrucomicrobiae bacterium]|nr:immunoglobulin domain-containing protein [Verrucomicrobiae bacterium]